MAITLTPLVVTNNFQTWFDRTNQIITELQTRVMTASPAGNTTTGNAILVGNFTANNLTANVASGVLTGFTTRTSQLRQITGNTSPIAVFDQLLLSNANTTPLRLVSATGPKIKIDNTVHAWDFGANTGLANTAFVFQFNGTTVYSVSHLGLGTFLGGLTANGDISSGSGRLLANTGTFAAPSHSFVTDPDTGVYSVSANVLGLSTGGVSRVQVDTTGVLSVLTAGVRVANGTVALPAYSFGGDPNSGFWSPGGDLLSLSLGGIERVRFGATSTDFLSTTQNELNFAGYLDINTSANTGIRIGRSGVASRISMLQPNTTTTLIQFVADEQLGAGQIRVANGFGATYPAYSFLGDTNTGIDNIAADSLGFSLGGVYRVTINPTEISTNIGLSFGAQVANTANNVTRHIDLWSGRYGFNVTGSSLNAVVPSTAAFKIVDDTTAEDTIWLHADGRVLAGLGSVTAPSLTFLGDPDAGFYRPSANILGVTTAGIERLRISGTIVANTEIYSLGFIANTGGTFRTAPGDTQEAPGFTWNGDQDLGFFRNSANIMGVTTGGLVRAYFSATGLTMANDSRIVAENGTAELPSVTLSSASTTGLYRAGTGVLGISGGGIPGVYVAPTYVRSLNPHRMFAGSAAAPGITWSSDTATGMFLNVYTTFTQDGVQAARIDVNDDLTPSSTTLITRLKGDARYVRQSSIRYKDSLGIIPENEMRQKLINAFDMFDLKSWIWGKEIDPMNVKYGTKGIGLIAEDVEKYLPEAVVYRYHISDANDDEDRSKKQANSLDPLPIIASLIEKIRELEDRLTKVGA